MGLNSYAITPYHVADKDAWTNSLLLAHIGDTLLLEDDWYVSNNYYFYSRGYLDISPRHIFSPTNQVLPGGDEYRELLAANKTAIASLHNVHSYHRMNERLHHAVVYVHPDGSLNLVRAEWIGNSRNDILKGIDTTIIDQHGAHTLLVCAANLEYYLVRNFGTGMGPKNKFEHEEQRKKVADAMALIGADIYGFVEVERGQDAIAELAYDLTRRTNRHYTYINDGGNASGSYTKSAYVYCSDVVTPYLGLRSNNDGVDFRKYMQCFEEKATGERFIFSLNHFKAKSGSGSGGNADKKDGQGSFNADRIKEAKSVLREYDNWSTFAGEEDVLIMGDLNAYGKEDPIRILTDGGMTDLHRHFHADSSYSYNYHGDFGYLDHALCNSTMLVQVTGMQALHINSDEHDCYTYDGSCNDGSMFRYSDHDPIIVGLRLQPGIAFKTELMVQPELMYGNEYAIVQNADGGYLRICTTNGWIAYEGIIPDDKYTIPLQNLRGGVYILHIYHNGNALQRKLIVP